MTEKSISLILNPLLKRNKSVTKKEVFKSKLTLNISISNAFEFSSTSDIKRDFTADVHNKRELTSQVLRNLTSVKHKGTLLWFFM